MNRNACRRLLCRCTDISQTVESRAEHWGCLIGYLFKSKKDTFVQRILTEIRFRSTNVTLIHESCFWLDVFHSKCAPKFHKIVLDALRGFNTQYYLELVQSIENLLLLWTSRRKKLSSQSAKSLVDAWKEVQLKFFSIRIAPGSEITSGGYMWCAQRSNAWLAMHTIIVPLLVDISKKAPEHVSQNILNSLTQQTHVRTYKFFEYQRRLMISIFWFVFTSKYPSSKVPKWMYTEFNKCLLQSSKHFGSSRERFIQRIGSFPTRGVYPITLEIRPFLLMNASKFKMGCKKRHKQVWWSVDRLMHPGFISKMYTSLHEMEQYFLKNYAMRMNYFPYIETHGAHTLSDSICWTSSVRICLGDDFRQNSFPEVRWRTSGVCAWECFKDGIRRSSFLSAITNFKPPSELEMYPSYPSPYVSSIQLTRGADMYSWIYFIRMALEYEKVFRFDIPLQLGVHNVLQMSPTILEYVGVSENLRILNKSVMELLCWILKKSSRMGPSILMDAVEHFLRASIGHEYSPALFNRLRNVKMPERHHFRVFMSYDSGIPTLNRSEMRKMSNLASKYTRIIDESEILYDKELKSKQETKKKEALKSKQKG